MSPPHGGRACTWPPDWSSQPSTWPTRLGARVGLNVIAAVIGVLAVMTGRLIHQKTPLRPWLLLGLTPGLVGLWLVLG